jgi:hypothetical protein
MIPSWLTISIITVPCGILFGLTRASSEEIHRNRSGFMLFGSGTLLQLLASGVVNALLVALLFIGPSALLLNIFDLVPLYGNNHYVWGFSLLGGAAFGKFIRWRRWKKMMPNITR